MEKEGGYSLMYGNSIIKVIHNSLEFKEALWERENKQIFDYQGGGIVREIEIKKTFKKK